LLREAWTLAIETLSWIELQRLGERLALAKAAKQLEIQDVKVAGLAHKLVFETLRRRNLLDFIINQALAPRTLRDFKLGPQAFLRLYTYETRFVKSDFTKAANVAKLGRSILGWRALKEVEEVLGRILSTQFDAALKRVGDEERIALLTCNPLWFVKYCFQLLGRAKALQFLESATRPLPINLRINTLKAREENILKKLETKEYEQKRFHNLHIHTNYLKQEGLQ